MRVLAVAVLLLVAAVRSDAQVNIGRTMPLGTLALTSSVALVDDDRILRTVVRVTNRGRDSTEILTPMPSCTVMLLIHREIRSAEAPIYDGRRKERVCTMEARMWRIAPDSSVTFLDTDSVFMYVGRLGSLGLLTGAGRIP
jgi:hypothetical protein